MHTLSSMMCLLVAGALMLCGCNTQLNRSNAQPTRAALDPSPSGPPPAVEEPCPYPLNGNVNDHCCFGSGIDACDTDLLCVWSAGESAPRCELTVGFSIGDAEVAGGAGGAWMIPVNHPAGFRAVDSIGGMRAEYVGPDDLAVHYTVDETATAGEDQWDTGSSDTGRIPRVITVHVALDDEQLLQRDQIIIADGES